MFLFCHAKRPGLKAPAPRRPSGLKTRICRPGGTEGIPHLTGESPAIETVPDAAPESPLAAVIADHPQKSMGSLSAEVPIPKVAEYRIADMKRLPAALLSGSGTAGLTVTSSACILAKIVKVGIVRKIGIAAGVHDVFSVCAMIKWF